MQIGNKEKLSTRVLFQYENSRWLTLFFVNLALILFHWEMFQIAWDFMCLLFGYDRCYILKDQNSGDYFYKKQNLKIGFDAAFSVNCTHK